MAFIVFWLPPRHEVQHDRKKGDRYFLNDKGTVLGGGVSERS